MSNDFYTGMYNPDVLSCLANLSNDEVFTPPEIANRMLDMLPQDIFSDPNTTFLDPACKSGVFLREIAKRLITGLEPLIPDLQERIDHIFQKQLYGIAITELTSLLSRRSVYCSKYPNSIYSITNFNDPSGNIRFKKINHRWKDGKCVCCGASQSQYDRDETLETHAYEVIHTGKLEEIFKMKFDVIIGNPPYHLSDGGAGASAKPIYHIFIEQAKKMKPKYLSMIIPARWYSGGKGLDKFRDRMLRDNHLKIIHDYINASDCFPSVDIKGGVCYFLWDRDSSGDCTVVTHNGNKIISTMERPLLENGSDTFIRYNDAIQILKKIREREEKTFDLIVSARKPFGLATNFRDYVQKKDNIHNIQIFAQKDIGFLSNNQIEKNKDWIDKWKILVPEAIGAGNMAIDIVKPIISSPGSICAETYVVIGPVESEAIANNIVRYIETKFFHFLLGLKKITQHTTSKTYMFIPLQDFTKSWTDHELYEKYNLTNFETDFIESSVWPDGNVMNGDNND